MKFSVFNGMPYGRTRMPGNKWPVPNQYFEPDQARRAVASCLEEVAMEDELGFDWMAGAPQMIPEEAMKPYQELIPQCTRIILYGAAHELPIATAQIWVKLVADFVDRGEYFVVNMG